MTHDFQGWQNIQELLLTCNHQLFHMYVGTKFKIHTNSTICMISLKPHAIILSA